MTTIDDQAVAVEPRAQPPVHRPLTGYLPIAEHGVVGDLHSAALVGTDGTIDWYCPERFDAPAVFGAILDRHRGGFYRIAPACADAHPKQLYLPNTNVLITRFLTPDGVGEVHDFMPIDAGPQRLMRRVVAVRGAMRFGLELEPRFDYARDTHEVRLDPGQARFISDHATLAFAGPAELTLQRTAGGVCLEFELQAGESHAFVLQTGGSVGPLGEEQADALERATADYWRGWLARSTYSGRWRETVHRSALALKLLSYQPTGAIVAAPTTSLPERIGGPRNWDYRFVWVRDFAFSLHALLRLGFADEAQDVNRVLASLGDLDAAESRDAPMLQVLYGIDPRSQLAEEALDHLEGYGGSRPVRVGNAAADQLQLDIYGGLLDALDITEQAGSQRLLPTTLGAR